MIEEVTLVCQCGHEETVERIDGELLLPSTFKEKRGKLVHVHYVAVECQGEVKIIGDRK